jgi:hypothetical protein
VANLQVWSGRNITASMWYCTSRQGKWMDCLSRGRVLTPLVISLSLAKPDTSARKHCDWWVTYTSMWKPTSPYPTLWSKRRTDLFYSSPYALTFVFILEYRLIIDPIPSIHSTFYSILSTVSMLIKSTLSFLHRKVVIFVKLCSDPKG